MIVNVDPGDQQEFVDNREHVIYMSPVIKNPIIGNCGEEMELVKKGLIYSKIKPLNGVGYVLVRTEYLR